eukprot:15057597-Alexandrium_andersonii.AAC.1
MSASLVGSEMCIRDRFYRLRQVIGEPGGARHCTLNGLGSAVCPLRSYAVLRNPLHRDGCSSVAGRIGDAGAGLSGPSVVNIPAGMHARRWHCWARRPFRSALLHL